MSSQLFLLTVVSVTVSSQITADKLQDRPNLTCLSSSDPAAVNATLLHGDHKDEGVLWSRDPTSAPLPQCSSSSFFPSPSHCEVCLLGEEVYILCDNLPAGAVLHLERPAIRTKESDCPILPPAGDLHPGKIIVPDEPKLPPDDQNKGHYGAVASPIVCVLIIAITGVVLWRYH